MTTQSIVHLSSSSPCEERDRGFNEALDAAAAIVKAGGQYPAHSMANMINSLRRPLRKEA